MRIKNPRRLSAACLLCAGVALTGASAAKAQTLPDLRGRNLSITGNLTASGIITYIIFPINISSFLPPGGEVIPVSHPAQLTIASTGSSANNALTGSAAIGTFDETVNGVFYPGFQNPSIPLTSGQFNRTTGAFSMSGTLNGISVIDFGVHDTASAGMGIKRALIQFTNLGLTLSGTGSLDSAGVFTIKNPGSNSFTLTANGSTPLLSIQDPALKTFQTSGAYPISNPAFTLTNWTAQTIVSGLVALEGIPDLTKISPNAPLNPFTFGVRAPGSLTPLVSITAPLVTAAGSAKGGYYLTGIPFGTYDIAIKGDKNLRVTQHNVVVNGSIALPDVLLPGGDSNNDNIIDPTDFNIFVGAYNSDSSVPGTGYDPTADYNYDGIVDPTDFGIFVSNYNTAGDK